MRHSTANRILSNHQIIIDLWDDIRKETGDQVGNLWWIPRAQILENVRVAVDELRISASIKKRTYEL